MSLIYEGPKLKVVWCKLNVDLCQLPIGNVNYKLIDVN